MNAKDMRRLGRRDLLEMMLTLRRENEQLHRQLAQAQRQLEDRRIGIEESGSLAEAALRLSGVFAAAQTACDQYTQNVQQRCADLEAETKRRCLAMLAQAKTRKDLNEEKNGGSPIH